MTAPPPERALRPAPPYGGDRDGKARPLSPDCPNTDPPDWLYWGYHCPADKEMRRNFGITCADYQRLLAAQDGKCGACGKQERQRNLAVDHDYDTHKIRGLLCNHCNRALTQGIARYLADPPAWKVGEFVIPEDRIETMERRRQQRAADNKKRRARERLGVERNAGNGSGSTLERIKAMTRQEG